MPLSSEKVLVVSAIIENMIEGEAHILLQTRWKPERDPEYSGKFELPAGCVEPFETLEEALLREVYEETGLVVTVRRIPEASTPSIRSLEPYTCDQRISGFPAWVNLTFICHPIDMRNPRHQPGETLEPRWVSVFKVEELLRYQPNSIFPLHFNALSKYCSTAISPDAEIPPEHRYIQGEDPIVAQ